MALEEELIRYAGLVEDRLSQLLPRPEERPFELHTAMRYSSLGGGKRLRPALCLVACQAVGGSVKSALDAAIAVELVHCFSLIHDDLPAIDNDDLRRGKPTCHKQFGEAVAILAGDALFNFAFQILADLTPAHALPAIQILTRATGSLGLVGGETIDILSEGKAVDEATLQLIHERKTGALIAASCEIGAVMGNASATEREQLRNFGRLIGLAFQIADDVLNETATAEELGKAAGSDKEREKATYPAIYGLEQSRVKADQLVDEALHIAALFPRQAEVLREIAQFAVGRKC